MVSVRRFRGWTFGFQPDWSLLFPLQVWDRVQASLQRSQTTASLDWVSDNLHQQLHCFTVSHVTFWNYPGGSATNWLALPKPQTGANHLLPAGERMCHQIHSARTCWVCFVCWNETTAALISIKVPWKSKAPSCLACYAKLTRLS